MKNFLLLILVFVIFLVPVSASNAVPLKYKNIKLKSRIGYNSEIDNWYAKASKNDEEYYTKNSIGENKYVYLDKSGSLAFETDCDYEFINNGKFICYSNNDLNFYNISFLNGEITKNKLSEEEIQSLIPEYKIIKISEFSTLTNSIKIKKHFSNLNVFVLNDADKTFEDYEFTSGNSKLKNYTLNGFVSISKQGMIQFSKKDDLAKNSPWFIILVR